MNETLVYGAGAIPAIVGLVQVGKDLGLPSRAAPATAVVLGILFGQLQLIAGHQPWAAAAATGIALGLSAVGLHAGVTTIAPSSSPIGGQSEAPPVVAPTRPRTPGSRVTRLTPVVPPAPVPVPVPPPAAPPVTDPTPEPGPAA